MAVHAFTSASFSYLNRASVLAESLRRVHPDWILWLVITDRPPPGTTWSEVSSGFDHTVFSYDLFGAPFEKWIFGHDIVEACTAVKGRAACHILCDPTCSKLFYFDPDIAVFNELSDAVEALDTYSIILTPHQVDPEDRLDKQAIIDNEIASLDYGSFNLGFIAIANNAEGKRFANWWEDRLRDWCHDKLNVGLFVDQKWCNLVPCFFDNVLVMRHYGYNVASWNISQRIAAYDSDGCLTSNCVPLVFYHFTKLGPIGDAMTRRYARGKTVVFELWWWYRMQVQRFSRTDIPKNYWHYGTFKNGQIVSRAVRELYRTRSDLQLAFDDPFDVGPGSFHSWIKAETNLFEMEDKSGFWAV